MSPVPLLVAALAALLLTSGCTSTTPKPAPTPASTPAPPWHLCPEVVDRFNPSVIVVPSYWAKGPCDGPFSGITGR
jgi:hypothetical protein